MKFGPIDGSTEEVQDLLQNNGLQLEDYLEKPAAPLKTRYLVVAGAILLVGLVASVALGTFVSAPSKAVITLVNLVPFGGGVWLTVSVQLRFRSGLASLATAVSAFLMLLIAAGIFSLQDAAEFIKGLPKDK